MQHCKYCWGGNTQKRTALDKDKAHLQRVCVIFARWHRNFNFNLPKEGDDNHMNR